MLGDDAAEFFTSTWGVAPKVFRKGAIKTNPPLHNFEDLLATLQNTTRSDIPGTTGADAAPASSSLIMQNGCPTTEYDSFSAAYLDGCSVVVNHMEAASQATHHQFRPSPKSSLRIIKLASCLGHP